MDTTLRTIIRYSVPYFAPNATQEMLDEWRPLMCPMDVAMGKAMIYLVMDRVQIPLKVGLIFFMLRHST